MMAIQQYNIQYNNNLEHPKHSHLGENLHDVTEDLHSPVNGSI